MVHKSISAYPLTWPDGWKRTLSPRVSNFRTSFTTARNGLVEEIDRLGGTNVILSSNVPVRLDGLPKANFAHPTDPGVAVYFNYKKKSMVFACDRFSTVQDNVQAIRLTVADLRGIERWGASDMMERAFRGFQGHPAPPQWWESLRV